MARRALAILVANSLERNVGEPVEFAPTGRSDDADAVRPLMRAMAHLVNVWLGLRGLRQRVLPLARQLLEIAEDVSGERDDRTMRRFQGIDWQRTLERRSFGDRGVVARVRLRRVDESTASYLSDVLLEVLIHAKQVAGHLERDAEHLPQAVRSMLLNIETWAAEARTVCSAVRRSASLPDRDDDEGIAAAFDRDLHTHVSRPLFAEYPAAAVSQAGRRPFGVANADLCRRLLTWRTQYFRGEAWISRKPGFQTMTGRDDALYEIWCFAELLNVARLIGASGVEQNSFLCRGRGAEPDFVLGDGRYAYFDFRKGRFKAVAPQRIADRGPALPRAHVEWFLRHESDYRQSVVIDTKYYPDRSWDSGEALKVLGYMMNFGVRNGAIVFPVSPKSVRDPERSAGLMRFSCPDAMNSTLWVVTLRPGEEYEQENASVITRFLKATIL